MDITLPFTLQQIKECKAGDTLTLTGTVYTARDAAHKRLCEMLAKNEPLPFPLKDAVIYFTGPCPKRPDQVIGSCGPTTSYRMDAYSPTLYQNGLRASIGKGTISAEVQASLKKHNALYLIATGGAGALLSKCIKKAETIAFPELGAESIKQLYVEKLPVIVGVDSYGNDIYITGSKEYLLNK